MFETIVTLSKRQDNLKLRSVVLAAGLVLSACGGVSIGGESDNEQVGSVTSVVEAPEPAPTTTETAPTPFDPELPLASLSSLEIATAYYDNLAQYLNTGDENYLDLYLAPEGSSPQLASFRTDLLPIRDYIANQQNSDPGYTYSYGVTVTEEQTYQDGSRQIELSVAEYHGDGSQSFYAERFNIAPFTLPDVNGIDIPEPVLLVTERYVTDRPD